MTFVQNLIAFAIPIGILAALVQTVDQIFVNKLKGIGPLIAGGGWISFQAWAVYFLSAGFNPDGSGASTPYTGLMALISYTLGIIASIAIFELGGALKALKFWAMPVTLVILVIPVIFLQICPAPFNYVPALFVGAGVFFALMSYMPQVPGAFKEETGKWGRYGQAALGELVYCALGLLAGWATVTIAGLILPQLS